MQLPVGTDKRSQMLTYNSKPHKMCLFQPPSYLCLAHTTEYPDVEVTTTAAGLFSYTAQPTKDKPPYEYSMMGSPEERQEAGESPEDAHVPATNGTCALHTT